MRPIYFETAEAFRAWLEGHHETADELWIGFYKKGSGRPSITWPEAVDEALCFGWIDSVRRSIDAERYANRFTPRKTTSNWSAVNVRRFGELRKAGRVRPAGLKAFEQRREDRTGVYSYEHRHEIELDPAFAKRFRAKKRAWAWFEGRPRSYRSAAIYWVMSAKKEETRVRRLEQLIEDSAHGRAVPPLSPRRAER